MPDARTLKSRGLKATLPRLQILALFQQSTARHLTAEDIYRGMIAQQLDVGLATVYRVLAQLERAGLVKQARFESGAAVFELDDGEHHDHLVCLDCGRVQEFHDPLIEARQKSAAARHGFSVVEHSHVLYGRCRQQPCAFQQGRPSALAGRRDAGAG